MFISANISANLNKKDKFILILFLARILMKLHTCRLIISFHTPIKFVVVSHNLLGMQIVFYVNAFSIDGTIDKMMVKGARIYLSRVMRKPTMWLPNGSDTNRAVQALKVVRGLKFLI